MDVAVGVTLGLVFLLAIYLTFLNPPTVARRNLRWQAREDYQHARGTIHLQMLRAAEKRLVRTRQELERSIGEAETEVAGLQDSEQRELLQLLQAHLVRNCFEVEGIGPALHERIVQTVFRVRLSDLHDAYRVHGVGERRQQAISEWVRRYEPQLSRLAKQEAYDGKDRVLTRYNAERQRLQAKVAAFQQQTARTDDVLREVQGAIHRLDSITEADFVTAALHPDSNADRLDAYLIGAFPAWKPVPAWFRKAVGGEEAR